jgi:hypothetical protein
MKQILALALSVALAGSVFAAQAQQGTATRSMKKKTAPKTAEASVSTQLGEMKQAIEAQQQQIRQLSQQVQNRDQRIQQLEQRLDQSQTVATQAKTQADTAAAQATEQQQTVTALKSDVTDLKSNATNTALALQETQKSIGESPLTLHYKGITITPGGYMAAETVWRQHGLGSDINTPFNSIPFDGASQTHLSEFFGSGRQSRISMLAEGKLGSAKLTGYVEADFLTTGITSNNNQSNSYALRQRQVWGQGALTNGWSFTGGQMWSLLTETKNGVDNRTEAPPMTIDAAYNVGFSWARQYGFRVSKNFNNRYWLAFSVEDPQTTVGGHGSSGNFLLGSQGASGGVYNPTANYSFNAMPDFVGKFVFQPKNVHFEVFGVASRFRDRVFPLAAASTPSASGAFNNSEMGGGAGANVRVSLLNKHLDAGLHFLGGDGIGRYGASGLSDVTVRPDGVLVPIRSYQTLATLEAHGPKIDIYFNFGSEYGGRTAFVNSKGKGVGYGSNLFVNSSCGTEPLPASTSVTVTTPTGTATVPVLGSAGTPLSNGFNPGGLGSNCTGDTRNILEGTLGFWYRLYKGPKGTLQFGPQISRIDRNTWSDKTGLVPQATETMVFTSFRYVLP